MKSIDSFRPPARRPASPPPTSQPEATRQGSGARFTKIKGANRRRRVPWGIILTILASPVLFGLALLGLIGVAVVAVYGVVALAARWPSRNLFLLALLSLLYMVGAQLSAASELARAMAVLVYAFLLIGVISLARELKSARRVWFKKH